jgi:thymidylate kinase
MSLIDKNEIFIMDRFHISEFVYNYTYKRLTFQDTFNNFQNYEQELIKIKHAILIVYLYARPDIIVNRFIEENENFEKSKDLFDLIKNYNFILKKTIFNYITIDTSSKEFLNKNVKEIIKTISDIKNK